MKNGILIPVSEKVLKAMKYIRIVGRNSFLVREDITERMNQELYIPAVIERKGVFVPVLDTRHTLTNPDSAYPIKSNIPIAEFFRRFDDRSAHIGGYYFVDTTYLGKSVRREYNAVLPKMAGENGWKISQMGLVIKISASDRSGKKSLEELITEFAYIDNIPYK